MNIKAEARKLFAKRDRLAAELAQIDQQLNRLRSDYMRESNTYGIHPTAFRREVEANFEKRAA